MQITENSNNFYEQNKRTWGSKNYVVVRGMVIVAISMIFQGIVIFIERWTIVALSVVFWISLTMVFDTIIIFNIPEYRDILNMECCNLYSFK